MSYPQVKLAEICDLQNGYAFKSADYVEQSNTLSCRMSNIRPGGKFDIEYNARFLPDNFAENYEKFLLVDGDVVIAMTDLADSPKILGVPTVIKTNGRNILLNQRVGKLIIKDTERVHFPYLQLALNSPKVRSIYKRFAGGGLQINLGKKDLLSVKIPLPPLAEQQKIAAILDAADQLKQKDQQLINHYTTLGQSLFLEMFGDPVINPMGWKNKNLGDICGIGSSKRVFTKELVNQGIPFYRGTEIGKLGEDLEIEPTLFITQEHYDRLKKQSGIPQKGDLLLPSICPDGRIFLVRNLQPFYFKDGRVLWIKVNKLNVNSLYLKSLLKQIFYTNYTNIASGTTFAELKIFALKKVKILLPPINLQNQFAQHIEKIEQQKQLAQASLEKSETLFNSLLQRAFKGELTQTPTTHPPLVNNTPSDEAPASSLT